MKRREIQKRLKDIIADTQQVIEHLEGKQNWFYEMKVKLRDLDKHVAIQGQDLFDKDEVLNDICYAFFENELDTVSNKAGELMMDIDAYADGLSEGRCDEVLERYASLENAVSLMDSNGYTDIELAIKGLEEAIGILENLHG